MEYTFASREAKITKKDVDKLKKTLQIGDMVWIEIESEEFVEDVLRKRITYKKRKVVKKGRNLVEIQTGSTKRVTITYKDILINDLKRKQKAERRTRNEKRVE